MSAQMCRHYCASGLQAAAVGADPCVRPSFCACHLVGQTHGSAPTASVGAFADKQALYRIDVYNEKQRMWRKRYAAYCNTQRGFILEFDVTTSQCHVIS